MNWLHFSKKWWEHPQWTSIFRTHFETNLVRWGELQFEWINANDKPVTHTHKRTSIKHYYYHEKKNRWEWVCVFLPRNTPVRWEKFSNIFSHIQTLKYKLRFHSTYWFAHGVGQCLRTSAYSVIFFHSHTPFESNTHTHSYALDMKQLIWFIVHTAWMVHVYARQSGIHSQIECIHIYTQTIQCQQMSNRQKSSPKHTLHMEMFSISTQKSLNFAWSSLILDWIFIYRIHSKNRKLLWNQYPLSNMCWQLHSIGAGDVINRCDKIKSDHIQYSSVLFTIVLRIRRFVILGVQRFFFRFVSCWNSNILLAHFSAFYFQKFVLIVMR